MSRDKGTPPARAVRKATGLGNQSAGLPNGESTFLSRKAFRPFPLLAACAIVLLWEPAGSEGVYVVAGERTLHSVLTRRRLLQIAAATGAAAAVSQLKLFPGLGPRRALSASGPTYRLTTDLGVPASSAIDVAGAIEEAVSRVAASASTLSSPTTILLEGFYRIDRAVLLEGLTNMRFAPGASACGLVRPRQLLQPRTWPAKVPWYSYLALRNCQDVALEGFAIQGPLTVPQYDPTVETAAGVIVQGASRRVTMRALSITGVHGDFISIAEHLQYQPTEILIEGVTGNICGRQMVADVGGNGTTIRRCHFRNGPRSGIDIEPSTPLGSHNITVEDSVFEDPGLNGIAGGNRRLHRNVVVRRTRFFGGSGLIKYGPPEGTPVGSHRGLLLEDVTYEWRPNLRGGKAGGSMHIARTEDIHLIRVNARFAGPPGLVDGTGEIRDSTFVSDTVLPPNAVVQVCGLTEIDNVGTGPCGALPLRKK